MSENRINQASKRRRLQGSYQDLKEENRRLKLQTGEDEIANLRAQIKSLKQEQEIGNLKHEIRNLKAALEGRDRRIQSLNRKIKHRDETVARLEKECQQYHEEWKEDKRLRLEDVRLEEKRQTLFSRLVAYITTSVNNGKIADVILHSASEDVISVDVIKTSFAECGLRATKPNGEIQSKSSIQSMYRLNLVNAAAKMGMASQAVYDAFMDT